MIETLRLTLKPLTYDQLLLYIRCDHSLESELGLNPSDRTIEPALVEALEQTILPHVADPARNYLFNTLWTAIDSDAQQMVGDLCFVGEPNEAGEVEIGYGTYPEFQGQGYMTEMVNGMVAWAKTQPGVKAIIASTDATNVASYRVLQKNNFVQTGDGDGVLKWLRKLDLE